MAEQEIIEINKLIIELRNPKFIAVIDCDSIIFSSVFGVKLLDENKQPLKQDGKFVYREKTEDEVRLAIDAIMLAITQHTKCSHILGFVKGNNTITDRKAINPEYKANRPTEAPKHYKLAKDHLINKWKVYETHGHEVDDAVNISRIILPNSFIVAIDKDLLSLEGKNYNWRKNEWVTVTKDEANLLFFTDLIAGQQGDNIKGLVGKGKAFANKVLVSNGVIPYSRRQLACIVLGCYIDHLGEESGIREFYKNYHCLKILDNKENFVVPKPIDVNELVTKVTFGSVTNEEIPDFDF